MGRRRKEQATMDTVEAVDAAEALPGSVEEQEGAPVETKIAAEYHEELPVKAPTKWLVLQDQTISLFGQMTLLSAGTIVSAGAYGPQGVKRIMEQKVMLEPIG
jgi:hypothetical protein